MGGGLFGEDAQREFLEEREQETAAPDHSATRRLNVRLPRPGETPPSPAGAPEPSAERDINEPTDDDQTAPAGEEPSAEAGARERQQDVVIRLSEPVVHALIAARNAHGVSTSDVVLDAVDRAWPDLEKVTPPMPERTSPLPPRTRRRRSGGSRGQRVHLRLTPSERATLEDVVDRTTAGSLTDLVERVLSHALGVSR
jgi:hypothetical protein